MRFGWSAKATSTKLYGFATIISVALLGLYILVYWFEPFSEFWNNFLSNFFLQVISLFAAIVTTMIFLRYEKTDAPRQVWGPFAVGLWLWFGGELFWGILNLTVGDVPIGLPDVFWVTSYFIMGLALMNQYRILFQPELKTIWLWVLLFGLSLFASTWLMASVFFNTFSESNPLDVFVNSFYPVGDLLLSIIALWLAHKFMGGAFARPWVGLLVFSVADLSYAWLEISGTYAWSLEQGNILSTISDVMYLAAYLVLLLGVLYHWLFLKYGLRFPDKP